VSEKPALRLRAEHEFPVPTLPLPADDSSQEPELLQENPAVSLFVQRAWAVSPAFELKRENAHDLVSIVRHLDGLPLGIELAAARIKLLSPAGIHARLNTSLKLLTGGPQDLPARQQIMRSAIEWSYDLLDQAAQTLFVRLGVFSGGFTIEAAEAVCRMESDFDVLDGIAVLLEDNLLRQAPNPVPSHVSTYWLLSTSTPLSG
jgi:predicted ATPase